jgi:hypothetical protein
MMVMEDDDDDNQVMTMMMMMMMNDDDDGKHMRSFLLHCCINVTFIFSWFTRLPYFLQGILLCTGTMFCIS